MRHYPINSPEAMSRLIALALLADGGLDRSELDALQRSQVLDQLGIRELTFHRITQELCDDLSQYVGGCAPAQMALGAELIDLLLADLTDPDLRLPVLRAMLDIVDADGVLADGEAVLIARAMALWQCDLQQVRG